MLPFKTPSRLASKQSKEAMAALLVSNECIGFRDRRSSKDSADIKCNKNCCKMQQTWHQISCCIFHRSTAQEQIITNARGLQNDQTVPRERECTTANYKCSLFQCFVWSLVVREICKQARRLFVTISLSDCSCEQPSEKMKFRLNQFLETIFQ